MSEEKSIEENSKPLAESSGQARPPARLSHPGGDGSVGQAASGKPTQSSELKKDNSEAPETKPTTSNQQLARDNMEVHKHPHDVTHKKKWTEYLLEFLMIFFAVFLGFIAENKREKIIEHSRAKEFAAALANNLGGDISQFNWLRNFRIQKNKQKDSLLEILSRPPNPEYDSSLHRLISQGLMSRLYYVPIDAAWQEVKSTGALRYIKRGVADSLVQYYTYIFTAGKI